VIDPSAGTESGHISHLNPKGITVGNITPAKK
jgi:oxalyl-CoA decarboxylase